MYRKDGQGNIVALIDSNGNVVVEYKYDAWGDHVIILSDSSNENLAKANPFRYRGYYYDEETGLYYLKSRYYDPETGRFITIDGISFLDLSFRVIVHPKKSVLCLAAPSYIPIFSAFCGIAGAKDR